MSYVTTIMVMGGRKAGAAEEIWIPTVRGPQALLLVGDDYFGGSKFPERDVFLGALNYVDLAIAWDYVSSWDGWQTWYEITMVAQGEDLRVAVRTSSKPEWGFTLTEDF